jgi:hypothetical protein
MDVHTRVELGTWLNEAALVKAGLKDRPYGEFVPPPAINEKPPAATWTPALDPNWSPAETISQTVPTSQTLPMQATQATRAGDKVGRFGQIGAIWTDEAVIAIADGWRFPYWVKTFDEALGHCIAVQKVSGIPAEKAFWGKVWARVKSNQMRAQGGAGFD